MQRDSFRWESVAAAVCLPLFWEPHLTIWGMRDGQPFLEFCRCLPWFVLGPALAVSALRHPRASAGSRELAWLVLGAYLLSPPFWATLGELWNVFRAEWVRV
jgi:hypothetical protein